MGRKSPAQPTILFACSSLDPALARALEDRGFDWRLTQSPGDAVCCAREKQPACAVIDLPLWLESDSELLSELHEAAPGAHILLLTSLGSVLTAVEKLQRRAAHAVLIKPVPEGQLLVAIEAVATPSLPDVPRVPTLERMQWEYIRAVLGSCDGNVSQAARQLGIYRQSLQRMLRRLPPLR
jgi:two-component system response regulator RegA